MLLARNFSKSVHFHFADVISKAMWDQILVVLETPALTTNNGSDNLNKSSSPRWVTVAVQPDPIKSEEGRDWLLKVHSFKKTALQHGIAPGRLGEH